MHWNKVYLMYRQTEFRNDPPHHFSQDLADWLINWQKKVIQRGVSVTLMLVPCGRHIFLLQYFNSIYAYFQFFS